jgi:hypothetical protein
MKVSLFFFKKCNTEKVHNPLLFPRMAECFQLLTSATLNLKPAFYQHHNNNSYEPQIIMFKLAHLVIALAVAVAVASPAQFEPEDSQVALSSVKPPSNTCSCPTSPSSTTIIPLPTLYPAPNALFEIYNNTKCTTQGFQNETDLKPDACYDFPTGIHGVNLLYNKCGQGEFWPLVLSPPSSSCLAKPLIPAVAIYPIKTCKGDAVTLQRYTCYNITSYWSVKLLRC